MWVALTRREQIQTGKKIRKIVLEGDIVHETVYEILRFGNHYFFIQLISQNGREFLEEQKLVTPYSIQNLLYHGFEILEEDENEEVDN